MVVVLILKNWDWVRPLAPLVGTKSQLWPKICFAGSPHHIIISYQFDGAYRRPMDAIFDCAVSAFFKSFHR